MALVYHDEAMAFVADEKEIVGGKPAEPKSLGDLAEEIFAKSKAYGTPLTRPQAKKIAMAAIALTDKFPIAKLVELEQAANPAKTVYSGGDAWMDAEKMEFTYSLEYGATQPEVLAARDYLDHTLHEHLRKEKKRLLFEPIVDIVDNPAWNQQKMRLWAKVAPLLKEPQPYQPTQKAEYTFYNPPKWSINTTSSGAWHTWTA